MAYKKFCDDLTKEQAKDISDEFLNSLSAIFIEDMLKEKFEFGGLQGAVSRILSDKYGRSQSEIKAIKSSFLLNLLITAAVIPPPEYAETVFKN